MNIAALGERGIIKRIARRVKTRALTCGIGDDTFAAHFPAGEILLGTTDTLIENTHFKRSWTSPEDLGSKAMAVNISDLAAMGGATPRYAMLSLGLPGDISVGFVDKLVSGMHKMAKMYGFVIAGGDTVVSKKNIVISISLIGSIKKSLMINRHGARPGDCLLITNTIGDAAAGLALLKSGKYAQALWAKQLLRAHHRPVPRLAEACVLAKNKLANSMMDVSDGLAVSAQQLAHASRCRLNIDISQIPLSRAFKKWASTTRCKAPCEFAVAGGEEYELVFTASPRKVKKIQQMVPSATVMGIVSRGSGVEYNDHGKKTTFTPKGFQHFAGSRGSKKN